MRWFGTTQKHSGLPVCARQGSGTLERTEPLPQLNLTAYPQPKRNLYQPSTTAKSPSNHLLTTA
eukprot:1938242-Pleurochrysis_carterae.AAC.2